MYNLPKHMIQGSVVGSLSSNYSSNLDRSLLNILFSHVLNCYSIN
jgi:hypothetical protein